MKIFACTAFAQVLVLSLTFAGAQSWVTVDDYQMGDNWTYGTGIATGSNGVVFAVGTVNAPEGITGVVRRSLDGGATWTTVDASAEWDEIRAVAVSPTGPVVVVGSTRPLQSDGQNPARWFTRFSEDGGDTWATVDDFAYSPGESCRAAAVDVAADGTIYVAGWDNAGHWLVRRRQAATGAWATVANLKHPNGYMGPLNAIKVTRGGVFLAGIFSKPTSTADTAEWWRVVRSTNQLASWQIVDDWLYAGSVQCHPRGLTEDSQGNLVVVGRRSFNGNSQVDWVTRRSVDGGNT